MSEQPFYLYVAARFGLTRSEARIAYCVMSGDLPRVIADRHGISIHTVRSQLKSVMSKTDTHSQLELALLLLINDAKLIAQTPWLRKETT